MAGIRDSLFRLRKLRDVFERRLGRAAGKPSETAMPRPSRLREVANFGANPGNLRMHAHVPENCGPAPALVVALHGCTQTAQAYDHGTGWSDLADRFGFVVIYPEQRPENNPKNCFSWFLPKDTARGSGEALSIRQMIEKAVEQFGVDRGKVFVTGLSAGGAMASAMLAAYPEVFAGGAIIAGLPHGSASSVTEAFSAMFKDRAPSSHVLGDSVRAASNHQGSWPKISVWHGTADAVVKPSNGEHIVRQWLNVQGLSEHPSTSEQVGRHTRRVWNDASGMARVEAFSVTGMSHGVPLATAGVDSCGLAGPFFLDAGLSSTHHIARFWGLDGADSRMLDLAISPPAPFPNAMMASTFNDAAPKASAARTPPARAANVDTRAIIEAALRAAGLMRN